MNPDLQHLIELQQLDDAIARLESEIQSLPLKIAEVEGQLSAHLQAVESWKKQIAENQRGRRKQESDIAALRDKISHYKDQTLAVKTNDAYRALLHEIEFHEADIRKQEDAILAEMIDSEALEKRLREAEQQLVVERAAAQKEIAAARERQREDEEKLDGVRAGRAETQSRLTPDMYAAYERLAKHRKGLAVVAVRDGTCGACHVRLRPQVYSQVRTNQQILRCESCDRILYSSPEPPAE